MTRRQAREQAFIMFLKKSFRMIFLLKKLLITPLKQAYLKGKNFSEKLSKTVYENLDTVDELIAKNSCGLEKGQNF